MRRKEKERISLPSTICYLPSAICYLPFAICHNPFSYQNYYYDLGVREPSTNQKFLMNFFLFYYLNSIFEQAEWQIADSRWQMADGRWQMADSRWQMTDGR